MNTEQLQEKIEKLENTIRTMETIIACQHKKIKSHIASEGMWKNQFDRYIKTSGDLNGMVYAGLNILTISEFSLDEYKKLVSALEHKQKEKHDLEMKKLDSEMMTDGPY